jgi:hypothetical protein
VTESGDAPVSRPRRRLIVVVGVIVAVLAVGIGGLVVGRATAPGPAIVVAPGPIVEQSPGASTLPSTGPRPTLDVATTSVAQPPAIFTPAADLPNVPGIATGFRLTRGEVEGDTLATTLARAFGLPGEVAQTTTGWIVGQPGGTVASVTVNDDPLLSWAFDDPAAAKAAAAGVSLPPDQARDMASALLASIGVDVTAVDWQVDRYADLTEVTAWQLLGGARTQLAWRLGFGKAGALVSASGFAAGLVEVPGYPVVGAATAVRRAALPTWATLGPRSLAATGSGATPTASPAASSAPAVDDSGRPVLQVPISDVVVTAAELGLSQFRQPDGDILILPAYELTGDDGSRWSLIAVTGDSVAFIDVPYPSASPSAP